MRELETDRLVIRPFTMDDLDTFAGLMEASFPGSTDLNAYRERLTYYTLGERVLAELRQPPYGDRAVVLKATERLIGSVGFVPCLAPFGQLPFFGRVKDAKYSPEVGLFYAVAPEHRGRGFASEAAAAMARFAFDHFNLQRIVATTEDNNAASAGVMRRIGMTVQRNPRPTPPWFQIVGILEAY
ncbi:MAG TPA: GNAT family N-acetyltransferase [bacterium]|nr:GNAT family N-acetyltransferase [bacterium]